MKNLFVISLLLMSAAYVTAWDAIDAYKAELKKQREKAND